MATVTLRSSPITGPSSLLRVGPPLCPASVLNPSRISRLRLSLPRPTAGPCWRHWPPAGAGRQVPTFHTRAQAKLTPPPCRTPPGQSAGTRQAESQAVSSSPVSMSSKADFDTSSVDRLRSSSWPNTCRAHGATFPQTLTTTALDRSSLRWFAASPCRAAAEDHQPNRLAPPSLMQRRIKQPDLLHRSSLLRSWHTRDFRIRQTVRREPASTGCVVLTVIERGLARRTWQEVGPPDRKLWVRRAR